MARNIEIKARIDNIDALASKAAALADEGPIEISQDDTFFACEGGRLKLRALSETEGELIFYKRPDQAGPKESFYVRSRTSEPASLCEALSLAYGQAGRVRKRRTLYLVGRTRVHLDRVENLGRFPRAGSRSRGRRVVADWHRDCAPSHGAARAWTRRNSSTEPMSISLPKDVPSRCALAAAPERCCFVGAAVAAGHSARLCPATSISKTIPNRCLPTGAPS